MTSAHASAGATGVAYSTNRTGRASGSAGASAVAIGTKGRTVQALASAGASGKTGQIATRAAAGLTARAVGAKAVTFGARASAGGSGVAQKAPAALVFPNRLPCPQQLTISPAERRALDSQQYPTQAATKERYRRMFERVVWPELNAARAAIFNDWWESDLVFGGAWFTATWPGPQGEVPIERHFLEPPRWEYTAGGFWKVSAVLETRAEGTVPDGLGPPLFHLRFDGNANDETGGSFSAATGYAAPNYVASATGFGQEGDFTYSGGGVGQNALTRVYTSTQDFVDAPEWQVDVWITKRSATRPQQTILAIERNVASSPLFFIQIANSSNRVIVQLRTDTLNGMEELAQTFSNSRNIVPDTRTHVRVTFKDGDVKQWHNGVLVAQLLGVAFSTTGLTGTTNTRVSVGAITAGNPIGTVWSAFLDGKVDELRMKESVDNDGPFTPPTGPF